MLNALWRDWLAIAGFVFTTAGLIYAIIQIRKTKSAAQAAAEAAVKALAESKRSLQKYAAGNAYRLINEAIIHVENREWTRARMRMNDLADLLAQLGTGGSEWEGPVEDLRLMACLRPNQFSKRKWTQLTVALQAKIDSWHGPFKEKSDDTGV